MVENELSFDPEKMTEPFVDDDYDARTGYDENFLGIPVPMPRVADPSIVGLLDDGGDILAYEHFSIVMHARRRLALFTAANIDGSPTAKDLARDQCQRCVATAMKSCVVMAIVMVTAMP